MQRVFLEIAFDGSAYHGWQVQPNAISVQEIVDESLKKIFRNDTIKTVGCGRTDTGVHASSFYLHFDLPEELTDEEKERYRLNNVLPFDIACKRILRVLPGAHARFDAIERSYEYRLHFQKDPFLLNHSTYIGYELDIAAMNKATMELLHVEDFAAFCKSGSDQHTTLCDVREASWLKQGGQAHFTIRADRFLRNMVRAIVGTLIDVGRSKISGDEFVEIIRSKDRSKAGTSAPAQGLYLTEVKYPYL